MGKDHELQPHSNGVWVGGTAMIDLSC